MLSRLQLAPTLPSVHTFALAVFALAMIVPSSSLANTPRLETLYQWALEHDALYQQESQQISASQEIIPIRRASLRPNINLSAGANYNKAFNEAPTPDSSGSNQQWSVQLNQPLFDIVAWQRFRQAQATGNALSAQQRSLEQRLLIRVTESFLAVLRAQVALELTQAEHQAQKRRLKQIQQRYKAGSLPITDSLEAQAAFDLAQAELIAAQNTLSNQQTVFTTIIGQPAPQLPQLKAEFPITPPEPKDQTAWISQAHDFNPDLISLMAQEKVALAEKKLTNRAYLPVISLTSSFTSTSGFQANFDIPDQEITNIGINATMPLYRGGGIKAAKREAEWNLQASKTAVELKKRQLSEDITTTYSTIITDIQRVKAQQQAVKSAKAALKATEASYRAGSREIVDVLLSEQQLYAAENSYANARYDYFFNSLKLHQAAGSLELKLILALDKWFE